MADRKPSPNSRAALSLTALGVVYGDIGTSPLYAVRETFHPAHGVPLEHENILGGISAIFWALMIVVSIKYMLLILRADNRGEGGIMALTALALSSVKKRPRALAVIGVAGLCGAALFYGEVVLTPAISVLAAVEGLEVGTELLKPYVLPISLAVLVSLFMLQRIGTGAVGMLFGPVTGLWFLALGAAGIHGILQHPAILGALNPLHGLAFVTQHGFASFAVLGAVLLAFTGAEALYADMGHLGRGAIRIAWFGLVFPALVLNYLGQGALLAMDLSAIDNPFYLLYPRWALYPMVALATAATVIASQATISAAYSLTKQAIQLGYLPRMSVVHTSSQLIGQVYMPEVNWILLLAVTAAVVGFGSSAGIAGAYGIAVTGTMLVTSLLAFFVYRYRWRYPWLLCIPVLAFFACFDLAFFSSSLLKVPHGGWFPLLLAVAVLTIMLTWRGGKRALSLHEAGLNLDLTQFLETLFRQPPLRVPGTAVFLNARPLAVPFALLHNLQHNKVLHERVLFLTVVIRDFPRVPPEERAKVQTLGHGCYRIILYYGFKDRPDVAQGLRELGGAQGLEVDPQQASFFLSRENVVPVIGAPSGMAFWRERLFRVLARNAGSKVDYYNIPANRVIELGTQIEI